MKRQDADLKDGKGIRIAVDIAIFNDKREVLLGKRLVQAGFGSWGFVGGHLKTGEKIMDGAKREIYEELGKSVQIELTNEILAIRENSLEPRFIHHITIIIKGEYAEGEIKNNEPEKCEEWKWFDLRRLPPNLFSGIRETLENFKQKKEIIISDWQ